MNIILLSGGSGKRLWPLSNDVRSKQFIKLFKNNDEYESIHFTGFVDDNLLPYVYRNAQVLVLILKMDQMKLCRMA